MLNPSPSLALLLLLAALAPSVHTSPVQNDLPEGAFSIPLYLPSHRLSRRSDPDTLRSWALREKGRILGKYGGEMEAVGGPVRRALTISTAGYGTATATSTADASNATSTALPGSGVNGTGPVEPVGLVNVFNFQADQEYFAPVGVGVPPQYMNVILDTGSADLWIASSSCTPATGCTDIPTFNVSRTATSVDTNSAFSVRYGSGSASGEVLQDFVGFAGYNVSSQGYALCDTVSSGLLEGNVSGLMGLGFQTLAASGITPFWQNLWQAGVLPFPGFAFHLTRSNDTAVNSVQPGGSVTFGYLNSSLFNSTINYVPIPAGLASYWLIPMDAVNVNGTNVTGVVGSSVAIDTGTTLIGGPPAVIKSLYSLVPGAQAATGAHAGYWTYPCNSSVNVSLSFGGIAYNMSSVDFNLGPYGVSATNVSTCLGAFFDLSLSTSSKINWVIGAAFLKNVYSVYRASPPSVGFALLSALASNSTSPYSNSTLSSSNTTYIPNGIFGPSGYVTRSAQTSIAARTGITTAIEAGQTARLPSEAGRRVVGWALGLGLLVLGVGRGW